MGVDTVVLSAWEDLAYRRHQWQALADRCGAGPESAPAWSIPRWRELGRGRLRAVAATAGDGALVGLGLFCESRAPGPKLVTALGRGTDPAVGMLVDPEHETVAVDLARAALGRSPALMVLEGTDDRSLLADAAAHGLALSGRPHPPGRVLALTELAADLEPYGSGAVIDWGGDPRADAEALAALTRAMGYEPGPATDRRRERSFLVTVIDSFWRAGNLVWPIVRAGGRPVATSAWLVNGDRASLWLRWSAGGGSDDLVAAINRLGSRGVREVVLRHGEPTGAGLGSPVGAETLLVHNRPGWRHLEPLAWAAVGRLA